MEKKPQSVFGHVAASSSLRRLRRRQQRQWAPSALFVASISFLCQFLNVTPPPLLLTPFYPLPLPRLVVGSSKRFSHISPAVFGAFVVVCSWFMLSRRLANPFPNCSYSCTALTPSPSSLPLASLCYILLNSLAMQKLNLQTESRIKNALVSQVVNASKFLMNCDWFTQLTSKGVRGMHDLNIL